MCVHKWIAQLARQGYSDLIVTVAEDVYVKSNFQCYIFSTLLYAAEMVKHYTILLSVTI